MKRTPWLFTMAVAAAVIASGCGGVGQKPGPLVAPQTPTAAPQQGAVSAPEEQAYEIIKESMLPSELNAWQELKQPPKSTGSARVGDYLYVLVTGGNDSIGASAIVVRQVTLAAEQGAPVIRVHAVLSPGKGSADTFPRSYLRIPYPVSRPVPGVMTLVEWQAASGGQDPTPPTPSPAVPPVAAQPTPPAQPAPAPPTDPGAQPGGDLQVKAISGSELPTSLRSWQTSRADVPTGVAAYAEGSLYVMVSAGQRPTGGYSVSIQSVVMKEGTVVVTALLRSPGPGQMVTQALTYPKAYALVKTSGSGSPPVIVNWAKN